MRLTSFVKQGILQGPLVGLAFTALNGQTVYPVALFQTDNLLHPVSPSAAEAGIREIKEFLADMKKKEYHRPIILLNANKITVKGWIHEDGRFEPI